MKALLASSPVTSQVLNVRRHSLACGDSAKRPFRHKFDEATLLEFSANPRAAVPLATFGSLANGQANLVIVSAIVESCDFDKKRPRWATEGKIRGRVQEPAVKPNMRGIDSLISIRPSDVSPPGGAAILTVSRSRSRCRSRSRRPDCARHPDPS
jgi:hypothetical protein